MNCLTTAWSAHEAELHHWALRRLRNPAEADDLMQDLFLKALRQGERFCSVHNARAWLFEVARNTLADRLRVARETVELPEDLSAPLDDTDTVDSLTACLPACRAYWQNSATRTATPSPNATCRTCPRPRLPTRGA